MLAGLLLVSVLAVMWSLLPLRTWAGKFDIWIHELGAWGFVAFWLFCVIGIVLLVPASVFAVAAGAAFGWEAIPIATVGSACAFFIARHFITKI